MTNKKFVTVLSLALSASLSAPGTAQTVGTAITPPPQGITTRSLRADVITVRGPVGDPRIRADVYVVIPYESMQFEAVATKYAASCTTHVIVRDSAGRKQLDTIVTRRTVESDYTVTRGATGSAVVVVVSSLLNVGSYKADVIVRDGFSRRETSLQVPVIVPDLLNDVPTLSTPMYVTEIEQKGDRYRIVPSIGDVVDPDLGRIFTFFEIYTDSIGKTFATSWNVRSADGRVLGTGTGPNVSCSTRAVQTFIPVNISSRPIPGRYDLTIQLHPVNAEGQADTTRIEGKRTRPWIVPRSARGTVLTDLVKAIRQLVYIAEQKDLDYIDGATNDQDREARFEDFWKRQDPTPGTVRNEAFDDYYSRIEAANKRFTSYADGWMTDMGRIFVVYGEPTQIDRGSSVNGVTVWVRWTYTNGQQFVFEDSTGFGDFRLRTPVSLSVKYKYRR
ncbi:MAG TPA: hypothetical protein DIS79_05375 [Bacteroidetes bacterium]|nr:hypothetical protein [Bacteroidota bacterium]HRK04142.1 GWxTD domain-containing protein [Chlorobiota bacterium]